MAESLARMDGMIMLADRISDTLLGATSNVAVKNDQVRQVPLTTIPARLIDRHQL